MKFKTLIKEVKGDLSIGDQIILPGSQYVWTIDSDEGEYFSIVNNTTSEKTMLSKFNLANVKKMPIFEFKTQEEKTEEIKRYKDKIREILSRSKPMTLEQRIIKMNQINIGWINYYGIAKCKGIAQQLDKWIRQRLRMCIWKQWKKVKTRYKNLKKLGLNHYQAIKFANTRKGYWRTANSAISNTTLTNQFFTDLGLKSLTHQYIKIH